MDEKGALVERALAYPYAIPTASFVQRGEATLDPSEVEVDLAGRIPLLAYGSNAAPSTLARKLGAASAQDPVPVMRATLADFDVVYSAHVSAYGCVPAAIQRSPGTRVATAVIYLTERQLELVSRTEPNYELTTLGGISCALQGAATLEEVALYRTRHGCLALDGSEVALAPVPATGRKFPALGQRQALERVREALAPELSLERFVLDCATDPTRGRRLTSLLRRTARPAA